MANLNTTRELLEFIISVATMKPHERAEILSDKHFFRGQPFKIYGAPVNRCSHLYIYNDVALFMYQEGESTTISIIHKGGCLDEVDTFGELYGVSYSDLVDTLREMEWEIE